MKYLIARDPIDPLSVKSFRYFRLQCEAKANIIRSVLDESGETVAWEGGLLLALVSLDLDFFHTRSLYVRADESF